MRSITTKTAKRKVWRKNAPTVADMKVSTMGEEDAVVGAMVVEGWRTSTSAL